MLSVARVSGAALLHDAEDVAFGVLKPDPPRAHLDDGRVIDPRSSQLDRARGRRLDVELMYVDVYPRLGRHRLGHALDHQARPAASGIDE